MNSASPSACSTTTPNRGVPHFSRGHLVLACAAAPDLDTVFDRVQRQPLTRTLPFHLLALSLNEGVQLLHWDGITVSRRRGPSLVPPLSSSSYATAEVIATRLARSSSFTRTSGQPQPAELAAYHRQHHADAGAHSVLMRRADAATRSISHVAVNEQHVRFNYSAIQSSASGPTVPDPVSTSLPRRTGPAGL